MAGCAEKLKEDILEKRWVQIRIIPSGKPSNRAHIIAPCQCIVKLKRTTE